MTTFTTPRTVATLPACSVLLASETATETQVCVYMPGHELDGMTIAIDFSQGFSRPDTFEERVLCIVDDEDLVAQHIALHLE